MTWNLRYINSFSFSFIFVLQEPTLPTSAVTSHSPSKSLPNSHSPPIMVMSNSTDRNEINFAARDGENSTTSPHSAMSQGQCKCQLYTVWILIISSTYFTYIHAQYHQKVLTQSRGCCMDKVTPQFVHRMTSEKARVQCNSGYVHNWREQYYTFVLLTLFCLHVHAALKLPVDRLMIFKGLHCAK